MKKVIQKHWALFFFGGFFGLFIVVGIIMSASPFLMVAGKPMDLTAMLLVLVLLVFTFIAHQALSGLDFRELDNFSIKKSQKLKYPNLEEKDLKESEFTENLVPPGDNSL